MGSRRLGRIPLTRGEIRWYTFRFPDKRRPVLVLARDEVIDRLNEIIVVPATRTIRGLRTELLLTEQDACPQPAQRTSTTGAQATIGRAVSRTQLPDGRLAGHCGTNRSTRWLFALYPPLLYANVDIERHSAISWHSNAGTRTVGDDVVKLRESRENQRAVATKRRLRSLCPRSGSGQD